MNGEPLANAIASHAETFGSPEPDMRHPKIQALIASNARRNILLMLVEQIIDDPERDDFTAVDMEYWEPLHDKLKAALEKEKQRADRLEQCLFQMQEAAKDLATRACQIDMDYASRLAFALECMLVDSHGHWNMAANLLDEYKREWEKVNPSPPTFMGEVVPRKTKKVGVNPA